MLESHLELRITATEWSVLMEDLDETLNKFDVPALERSEVIAIVESTRNDIVVAENT